MISVAEGAHAAGSAFDLMADSYDALFTASKIGRSQRSVVWQKAAKVFRGGDRILELNCGTGEDALFLARQGVSVTAFDASARMVEQARARMTREAPSAHVTFDVFPTEELGQLPRSARFDGVFSNFSGLNCVADLATVARPLAEHLPSGAQLLLCLSTRFCLWEILHYIAAGDLRKAFRRCSGSSQAQLGGYLVPVFYPTLRSVLRSFGRGFRLRSVTGVGLAVPPSYMEGWARRNPSVFRLCEIIDRVLRRCPAVRVLGDHMLVHLERV